MKSNTGKLLIALVVLIAVFAVIKFTGNNDRSRSLRSELVSIDTASITRIEIESPQQATTLVKKEGQWYVSDNNLEIMAVNNSVRSMLTTLNTIEPSRLAARSESQWKDFSVDSTGTRVMLYEGDKVVTDIVLGRFGFEGQRSYYTYVRLSEDEDVYVAENFMKMSISEDGAAYRNNVLARINTDSINSIQFDYPDSAFQLQKTGDQWQVDGHVADSASTAQYLLNLAFVSSASRNFSDISPDSDPIMEVTVGGLNEDVIFSAYEAPEAGKIIGSSKNREEFFQDEALFSKIFVTMDTFISQ